MCDIDAFRKTFLFLPGKPDEARNPNDTRKPIGSRKPSVTRKTICARNGKLRLGKIMMLNGLFRGPLRGEAHEISAQVHNIQVQWVFNAILAQYGELPQVSRRVMNSDENKS